MSIEEQEEHGEEPYWGTEKTLRNKIKRLA